jgi:molecular chaperone DnaJ
MEKRDYYDILGISKDASPDEIKKAYRKLAVKHHPDKEGGNETKFKEASEAYEVLKDETKRQRYDQFGHAGVGGNSGSADGGNPFGQGFDFNGGGFNFDFGGFDMGDIFGNFFGGGGSGRGSRKGRDLETQLNLSFEDAIFGTERKILVPKKVVCYHCEGKTREPGTEMKACDTCKGHGQVNQGINTPFGVIQNVQTCPTCKGSGKVPESPCSVCAGRGVVDGEEEINIKIPAGVDDGMTIRLQGKGEAAAEAGSGDLYVVLNVSPHKKFTREGDLILSSEHIAMADAALGTEIDVETVDGKLKVKIPAGIQSGTDIKLSGHGVPHVRGGSRGAHIVRILVDTPIKLSKKQKELLEEFKKNKKRGLWG